MTGDQIEGGASSTRQIRGNRQKSTVGNPLDTVKKRIDLKCNTADGEKINSLIANSGSCTMMIEGAANLEALKISNADVTNEAGVEESL